MAKKADPTSSMVEVARRDGVILFGCCCWSVLWSRCGVSWNSEKGQGLCNSTAHFSGIVFSLRFVLFYFILSQLFLQKMYFVLIS